LSLNLKPLGMHSRVRSRSLGFLGTSLLLTFAGGADQLVRVVEAALRGCATVNSTLVSLIDYSEIGPPNHGFICCQPLQEGEEH
jgi:hypothetical protein